MKESTDNLRKHKLNPTQKKVNLTIYTWMVILRAQEIERECGDAAQSKHEAESLCLCVCVCVCVCVRG